MNRVPIPGHFEKVFTAMGIFLYMRVDSDGEASVRVKKYLRMQWIQLYLFTNLTIMRFDGETPTSKNRPPKAGGLLLSDQICSYLLK
ncbi:MULTISPECIES: hypothetical protein [Bacillales]|uniref:hypothetical protein n=1 Tax=Bacillales TaxID=1385 RepID=UPI0006A7DFE3|nr:MULTISPECIES: hypothetical protein [Bacillales]OBZ09446.1 hypothetical protein A7975_25470 [Bacillus sp. FJAT-26390]